MAQNSSYYFTTASATEIMSRDAELLASLQAHPRPILHHYDWTGPSATYGYFTKPEEYFDESAIKKSGLSLARRPTGGGIIFHQWDLAFSILIPANHHGYSLDTLANYAFINQMVMQAITQWNGQTPSLLQKETPPLDSASRNFCMAKPTKYDVMLHDKKVGGAAQRRTRWGFLHQGSLSLIPPPPDYINSLLKPGSRIPEAMQLNSAYLLETCPQHLLSTRQHLREILHQIFVSQAIS